ncbi:MAG: ABC transporter ATP-binding protein [Gammaproteobacteria bacterium]|nr:ABC transporter ATP-binding protein [Gammaproteobacteria bacterium]MDE1887763.1 ABC transporter ATP-binding protein [Gammaproteobacteria bacterium]MDE2024768.1 ABC transporter ATP-binding protein [Gammaproteobacteria bacterium]MDE2140561.1 ABC transporter ATP-binding protein [Gammaproteobacteria bacterium]MDE2273340.1 ABC transporter ATP-binding protein [Gammaproteobacteria bacterium]
MSGHEPLLRAEHLGKQVTSPNGVLAILDDVSFSVGRGASVAIAGPSGSGKSTLLGLLAGLDVPTQGRVWLDGEDLSALGEDQRAQWRARQIGFVFQSFHLLPGLSVLENVMLPLELAGAPDPETAARATLASVGLTERANYYPPKLSGGEQQRVAIARAYAGEPAILFADEPTGNLDAATGRLIIDLLFRLNAEHHSTLVLVTHDPELAGRCERVLNLHAGRLITS